MAGVDANPPTLRVQRLNFVGGLGPDPRIALPPRQQDGLAAAELGEQIVDVHGRPAAVLGNDAVEHLGRVGVEAGDADALHQFGVDVGVRHGIHLPQHLLDPGGLLGVNERCPYDGPLDPFLDGFDHGIRLGRGFGRCVRVAEPTGSVEEDASLDEILPAVVARMRSGIQRGETTQRVPRHNGRFSNDLVDEIQRLVTPHLGRVVLQRFVRQAESQQIKGVDVIVLGQLGDVVAEMVRRRTEAMDEQEGGLGLVAQFQIIDGVVPLFSSFPAAPLPSAVAALVPRETFAGMDVEGIEGIEGRCAAR
mmetsp:Transcript_30398/g.71146  ORF Transcript_30398/g.71146 Transcript_30398/m.71146 type:complete len:306 (-) Transcript_30398:207-1124(-)